MKMPDEIKKGLEQCVKAESGETGCSGCPYIMSCIKEEDPDSIMADALSYIQQLETRLAQVERERDAAIDDLRNSFDPCTVCKKQDICEQYCPDNDYNCPDCKDKHRCICHNCTADNDLWEWRGICPQNTKEESTC